MYPSDVVPAARLLRESSTMGNGRPMTFALTECLLDRTLFRMVASPNETIATDEQLAEAVSRRGESEPTMRAARDALGELYARHARKLLGFLAARVRRSDLEDVHQEVWQRVWERLPAAFHGGNFRAWLHQITRNYLIDRSRKKRPDTLADDYDPADPRQQSPDQPLVEQERMDALRRCMDQLAADAASLVRARLAGEEYDEICARLGLRPAQGHKLFHQAKEQLKNCVERSLA